MSYYARGMSLVAVCCVVGCGRPNDALVDHEKTSMPTVADKEVAREDGDAVRSAKAVQAGAKLVTSSDKEYRRAKDEALAIADKLREQGDDSSARIPLPNFAAGAGLPPPIGINFYEQRPYYPGYLLCTYDVEERRYDRENEGSWFQAALLQIRGEGADRFPPYKWVAVVIRNRPEQRTVGFEQAHKAGAIFELAKVFDRGVDPARLVAHAEVDRHPIAYDAGRPTPGEQDRWLIVERGLRKVNSAGK